MSPGQLLEIHQQPIQLKLPQKMKATHKAARIIECKGKGFRNQQTASNVGPILQKKITSSVAFSVDMSAVQEHLGNNLSKIKPLIVNRRRWPKVNYFHQIFVIILFELNQVVLTGCNLNHIQINRFIFEGSCARFEFRGAFFFMFGVDSLANVICITS